MGLVREPCSHRRGLYVLLYSLIFLLFLNSVYALHTFSANLIPVQGYETTTAGLNLTATSFGSQDVVISLDLDISPLEVISVADYAGWTESFSGGKVLWQNGTLESNIILALFELTAKLPIVTQNTTYDFILETADNQGFIQQTFIQFVVLDDDTGPILDVFSPIAGSFVMQGTSDLLAEANATDPETGVSYVSFSYSNCIANITTITLAQSGQTYSSVVDVSEFLDSETVCFRFDAENKGGTITTYRGNFTIDGVAPWVNLNFPADAQKINNDSYFEFVPHDNLAPTLNCNLIIDGVAVDSGVFNNGQASIFTITNAAEGPHTWAVECMDLAGWTGISETRDYILDKTPPQIELVGLTNGSTVMPNNIFWVNITDNFELDSYYYEYEGVDYFPGTNLFSISTFGWLEGIHIVNVYANDSASNNAFVEFSLIIDLTPPVVELIAPNNQSDVNVNFIINATDNYDSILDCEIYLNGTLLTSGQITTGSPDVIQHFVLPGNYIWYAICTDDGANSASSSYSLIFEVVDISGPTILLDSISSVVRGGTVYIEANITDYSSILFVEFEIVDSEGTSTLITPANSGDIYSAEFTTSVLSPTGTYSVVINAVDSALNPSSESGNFDVDYSYDIILNLNPSSLTVGGTTIITGSALFDNSSLIQESEIALELPSGSVNVPLVNGIFEYNYTANTAGSYPITASVLSAANGITYNTTRTLIVSAPSTAVQSSSSSRSSTSGKPMYQACGDNICQATEDCSTCPEDCGKCKIKQPEKELEAMNTPENDNKGKQLGVDEGEGKKIGIIGKATSWFSDENINWKGVGVVGALSLLVIGGLALLGWGDNKNNSKKASKNLNLDEYLSSRKK